MISFGVVSLSISASNSPVRRESRRLSYLSLFFFSEFFFRRCFPPHLLIPRFSLIGFLFLVLIVLPVPPHPGSDPILRVWLFTPPCWLWHFPFPFLMITLCYLVIVFFPSRSVYSFYFLLLLFSRLVVGWMFF